MVCKGHRYVRDIVVFCLASLVLLASCATPAPSTTTSTPIPAPTAIAAFATALPTIAANWTTYTDPVLGYSLSFPQDVEFTSGTSKAGVHTARLQFSIPGADGYQGMVLRVEPNPQHRGIEQIVGELYRRNRSRNLRWTCFSNLAV